MEIALLIWIVCGVAAAFIGSRKGEGPVGLIAGLLLGPLGIFLALLSSGNRLPCPFCKEPVHRKAVVCPHCRRSFSTPQIRHSSPN
jgi:hypothetical protein